ncbi:GFA family protein [Thalassotalea sp. ND16A]|uniref:GFA family protein n=1 Tax=Thalassotalea sp. ND16A TaxID=1535422 RepID=UPI00051A7732|nr:GFA family protein [Thalassotalea sp. ND16A]KGJ91090.1 hypothetical protein ND16A_0166 [Thalassotalea sp. ND16A]
MNKITGDCEGGCACGYVRYKIVSEPLIVHCCHCRQCQRQTGASFALNALFEASKVELLSGKVNEIMVPSPSGRGQKIARCPKCEVAIWSNYYMMGIKDLIRFIRVGTLDNPDLLAPDVHIYTESKQPWINLSAEDLVVKQFYDFDTTWTSDKLEIRQSLLAKVVDK